MGARAHVYAVQVRVVTARHSIGELTATCTVNNRLSMVMSPLSRVRTWMAPVVCVCVCKWFMCVCKWFMCVYYVFCRTCRSERASERDREAERQTHTERKRQRERAAAPQRRPGLMRTSSHL